jgi:hypothetical protein
VFRDESKAIGGCRTEKIMRKNGLKWSNISVKKYHHRPGLGVKSGKANLHQIGQSRIYSEIKWKKTHSAPQTLPTHDQPPDANVEANVRTKKYAENSARCGNVFLRETGNFLGEARRETGSVRSRSSKGAARMIDESEEWTRNVSDSNEADERPAR